MSIWNDLANSVFDGVGLAGLKSRANASLLANVALSLLQSSTFFPFLFFLSIGWYCGAGVFGLIGCIPLSDSLALPTFFNNNNNIPFPSLSTFYTPCLCSVQRRWYNYSVILTLLGLFPQSSIAQLTFQRSPCSIPLIFIIIIIEKGRQCKAEGE